MNDFEEIEAAIERLLNLRDDAHFGPWWHDRATEDLFSGPGLSTDVGIAAEVSDDDADLIVTLHRTIDAQLDTLRTARAFYGAGITGPESATAFAELALALARSINGGAA